jgi:hypothetical protein
MNISFVRLDVTAGFTFFDGDALFMQVDFLELKG